MYLWMLFLLNSISLLIASMEDIREKQIRLIWILLFMLGNCASAFLLGNSVNVVLMVLAGGVFWGIVFLGISFLTGEMIGKGDALMILAGGLSLGFFGSVMVIFYALCLSSIMGLFLLHVRKLKGYEIPFIPFYGSVYIVWWGINLWERTVVYSG